MALFPQSMLPPCLGWADVELGKGRELSALYIIGSTVSKLFAHLWELLVVGLVLCQHCLEMPVTNPFFPGILASQLPVCFTWFLEVTRAWAHGRAQEWSTHSWSSFGRNSLPVFLSTNFWDFFQSGFIVDQKWHRDSVDECPEQLFLSHHQGIEL